MGPCDAAIPTVAIARSASAYRRYIVDNAGEMAFEMAGEGTDIVDASVSYGLAGRYIETLRLTGASAIDGAGNGESNSLHGNASANRLDSGGSDDKLYGGAGSDRMTGGGGLDRFIFDSALDGTPNVDSIADFSSADDAIYLARSIFTGARSGTLAESACVMAAPHSMQATGSSTTRRAAACSTMRTGAAPGLR